MRLGEALMRRANAVAGVLGLAVISVVGGRQMQGADQLPAGHQALVSTVQPRSTPQLPEGHTGIAAKDPGDVGIEKDPDVIFEESFEGSVDEICSHWDSAAGKPIMSKSDDVAYDKFIPFATKRSVLWDYQQGKGVPVEGGRPFPGFAWRTTPLLNINAIWLYRYMSRPERGTSKVWWDHLVVAKRYIGPLTPKRP
jgi:hypothetical protein